MAAQIINRKNEMYAAAKAGRLINVPDNHKAIFVNGKHSGYFLMADKAKEANLAAMREIAKIVGNGNIVIRFFNETAEIIYNPEAKIYQVWRNDMPVFEWANGTVCTDQDALADCLM